MKKKVLSLSLIGCIMVSGLPLTSNTPFDSLVNATTVSAATEANHVENVLTSAATKLSTSSTTSNMGTSSMNSLAEGEMAVTRSSEPTQQELEKIIKAVKAKISIPNNLSAFDYYYNGESYYSQTYWNLNWSSKDGSERITIQADGSGNIISYDYYNANDGFYAPKYLKSELKSTADQFLNKIAPNIYKNVNYKTSTFQGVYGGQYIYQYERVSNGIPMPDNTISVGVNYETGKVASYYGNWLYDVKIPSADTKISESEAAAKIGKEVMMKLGYQNKYTTDKNGKTKIEAFLVYYPDQSYIAVDAKTGEVYKTQNEVIYDNYYSNTSSLEASDEVKGGLTEEEILKVEELSGLISREAAIKAVTGNSSLLIDSNLKSITAKLYKRSNYYNVSQEEVYVWDIYLSDPREANYETGDIYRSYATASVDAKTGKILNFNASIKDYYNMDKKEWESVKVKYSMKQGQSILEKFVKAQIPDIFKNTVLTNNKESYVIGIKEEKEVYGGYYYNYERVNEGVNYSANGIYGAVDGVTGKIYSFSYNWDKNITFESPKNVISAEKAFDYYIALDGFKLVYESNSTYTYATDGVKEIAYDNGYSRDTKIRLVYRTDIYPGYISPFTGRQLDYEGKEYKDANISYNYSDIGGLAQERNIKLLADLGIGYTGGSYSPNKEITKEEVINFISLLGYYYDTTKYTLESNSSTINRLDAAKFMIQILDYDKVAQITGIYNIDFKDKANISDAFLGYAALSHGLGLVKADTNNEFRPSASLTRAEAADMFIALLFAR
ncbi:MAG: hypothetical protein K0R21_964 [Anaerocolumna sp.]|jgi:hypothetical protein|nr:hypothetical protein [Anaerocolumna sp.]